MRQEVGLDSNIPIHLYFGVMDGNLFTSVGTWGPFPQWTASDIHRTACHAVERSVLIVGPCVNGIQYSGRSYTRVHFAIHLHTSVQSWCVSVDVA